MALEPHLKGKNVLIPGGSIDDVDDAAWRAGWELKVFGYIHFARAYLDRMRKRGKGVIINMIGAGGESLDYDYAAGAVGNASLMAFTRTVGSRSIDDGVRICGVNPGPTDTDRIVCYRASARSRCSAMKRNTSASTRTR